MPWFHAGVLSLGKGVSLRGNRATDIYFEMSRLLRLRIMLKAGRFYNLALF
jgi:hypothetical protein